MDHDSTFQSLLKTVRDAYAASPDMTKFRRFPITLERQKVTPNLCPCSDVFRNDSELSSNAYPELLAAVRDAGPVVYWRETYKAAGIGDAFLNQFGCFCIIGDNGPFFAEEIRLFIVYMPRQFYYPFHHHPAEELYMVVSGSAVFKRDGLADECLGEGGTAYHQSNQPHAMETFDEPVLCLVAWRNHFQTLPVFTEKIC